MRRFTIFAGASLAIIVAAGALFWMLFRSPADHRAIAVSGALAFGVQLFAFAVMLMVRGRNVFAAWGLGILLRFVVLVVYAFLVLQGFGMPPESALFSLVTFFFLSTLVEPVLLRP
ncbi:MAG TPA: hypothetical protein VF041_07790 [Gemmatimonadaceae bacterium]